MILFPNAKINIGLYVTEKRSDGFHNLETIFYPVPSLADILEIKVADAPNGMVNFKNSGLLIDCPEDKNLVIKAYRLLEREFALPAVNVHLHKIIPFGAGLGGGSADAAFMLVGLNSMFNLGLSEASLEKYAAELGSDCAFFIKNKPAFAHGRGELLEAIDINLDDYQIVVEKPDVAVSTKEAYAGISPTPAPFNLRNINNLPIEEWRNYITNDFEKGILKAHPEIQEYKDLMYKRGAVYASMSGSGSAVFGIFKKQ